MTPRPCKRIYVTTRPQPPRSDQDRRTPPPGPPETGRQSTVTGGPTGRESGPKPQDTIPPPPAPPPWPPGPGEEGRPSTTARAAATAQGREAGITQRAGASHSTKGRGRDGERGPGTSHRTPRHAPGGGRLVVRAAAATGPTNLQGTSAGPLWSPPESEDPREDQGERNAAEGEEDRWHPDPKRIYVNT